MGCSCALSSPALAADPRWAGDISKKLPNRWTFLDYIHYYIPIIADLYYSVYYTHYPLSWGQRRPFLGTERCRRSFFGIVLKYGHVCNKTREGQPLIEIICVQYCTVFFRAGWFFEDLWFAIPGMVPFQRHLSPPNIPLGGWFEGTTRYTTVLSIIQYVVLDPCQLVGSNTYVSICFTWFVSWIYHPTRNWDDDPNRQTHIYDGGCSTQNRPREIYRVYINRLFWWETTDGWKKTESPSFNGWRRAFMKDGFFRTKIGVTLPFWILESPSRV